MSTTNYQRRHQQPQAGSAGAHNTKHKPRGKRFNGPLGTESSGELVGAAQQSSAMENHSIRHSPATCSYAGQFTDQASTVGKPLQHKRSVLNTSTASPAKKTQNSTTESKLRTDEGSPECAEASVTSAMSPKQCTQGESQPETRSRSDLNEAYSDQLRSRDSTIRKVASSEFSFPGSSGKKSNSHDNSQTEVTATTSSSAANSSRSANKDCVQLLDLRVFKTEPCTKENRHNQKKCKFHHNKDQRRPLGTYSSEMCKFAETGRCPDGDACPKAHNRVESFYHPEKYKAKFCNKWPRNVDSCDFGNMCAFAHYEEELSIDLLHKMEQDADFYMFHFKTVWCPFNDKMKSHQRDECEYAHNWQDYRRKPHLYEYSSREQCRFWCTKEETKTYSDGCDLEYRCLNCHGWKEKEYHPDHYKVSECDSGVSCRKKHCPYYHSEGEARKSTPDFRPYPRNRGTSSGVSHQYVTDFLMAMFRDPSRTNQVHQHRKSSQLYYPRQSVYGCGPQSTPILDPQMVLLFQKSVHHSHNSDLFKLAIGANHSHSQPNAQNWAKSPPQMYGQEPPRFSPQQQHTAQFYSQGKPQQYPHPGTMMPHPMQAGSYESSRGYGGPTYPGYDPNYNVVYHGQQPHHPGYNHSHQQQMPHASQPQPYHGGFYDRHTKQGGGGGGGGLGHQSQSYSNIPIPRNYSDFLDTKSSAGLQNPGSSMHSQFNQFSLEPTTDQLYSSGMVSHQPQHPKIQPQGPPYNIRGSHHQGSNYPAGQQFKQAMDLPVQHSMQQQVFHGDSIKNGQIYGQQQPYNGQPKLMHRGSEDHAIMQTNLRLNKSNEAIGPMMQHQNSSQDNSMMTTGKHAGFYQQSQSCGSMPQLLQRQFRLQSDENKSCSSHEDKNSATGSKVWGNSVLSANFEAPIDDEDEIDIRQVASMNTIRHFLLENDLQVLTNVFDRLKHDISLEELRRYSDDWTRQFFRANAEEVPDETISRLIVALHRTRQQQPCGPTGFTAAPH